MRRFPVYGNEDERVLGWGFRRGPSLCRQGAPGGPLPSSTCHRSHPPIDSSGGGGAASRELPETQVSAPRLLLAIRTGF